MTKCVAATIESAVQDVVRRRNGSEYVAAWKAAATDFLVFSVAIQSDCRM